MVAPSSIAGVSSAVLRRTCCEWSIATSFVGLKRPNPSGRRTFRPDPTLLLAHLPDGAAAVLGKVQVAGSVEGHTDRPPPHLVVDEHHARDEVGVRPRRLAVGPDVE